MYTSEDTRRRFFGHISPGDGFNRESVLSGASSPGLRGSFAGAQYDSDDGSAIGFAHRGQPAGDAILGAGVLGASGVVTDASSAVDTTPELRHDDAVPASTAPAGPASGGVDVEKSVDSVDEEGVGAKEQKRRRDRVLGLYAGRSPRRRHALILAGALVGLIILALVIALPVALTRNKGHGSNNTSNPGGGDGGGGDGGGGGGGGDGGGDSPPPPPPPPSVPTTGGDGSTITTDKNTTFTYRNPFGGFWVDNPDDPFNFNAQAQSCVLLSFSPFF